MIVDRKMSQDGFYGTTREQITVTFLKFQMMFNTWKGPLCYLRTMQALISLCINLGLCCPILASVDTVLYISKQKMPRLDCTNTHADLDLHCPQIAFLCIVHHMQTDQTVWLNSNCLIRIYNVCQSTKKKKKKKMRKKKKKIKIKKK